MSDANARMAALAGVAIAEVVGPVTMDSVTLQGEAPVTWGTSLSNVRSLTTAGGSPSPISFDGTAGQIEIFVAAAPDLRFYAEFTATWPADRHFRWDSGMAGGGQMSGRIDPVGQSELWFFATPAIGPEGELVVGITPQGAADPGEEYQLTELRFWLFR